MSDFLVQALEAASVMPEAFDPKLFRDAAQRIHTLEAENARLRRERDSYLDTIGEQQRKLDGWSTVDAAKCEITVLRDENTRLRAENAELGDVRRGLLASMREVCDLRAELAALKKNHYAANEVAAEQTVHIERLTDELAESQEHLKEASRNRSIYASELATLQHQVAKACQESGTVLTDLQPEALTIVMEVCRAHPRLVAELAAAQNQIPHPGDGSCDNCGRIPSVNIPTSLCPDCVDAHAELEEARKDGERAKDRLLWCLRFDPKRQRRNGLPTEHRGSERQFWWHRNKPDREYTNAHAAIDAAMEGEG